MLRSDDLRSLRCGNQVIEIGAGLTMGILNATPDSFFEASRTGNSVEKALERAHQMASEGAIIIDIGGMSTRPGAEEISEKEELRRVIPVIEALHSALPDMVLSIDTYRSVIAQEACKAGAGMINDISGGEADSHMYKVVSDFNVAYVLMHTRGTPKTMQQMTDYEDVVHDLIKYFIPKIKELHKLGVYDIILDPGFGFAKTPEQNFQIIRQLETFRFLGHPILVGVSRKSTLSKTVHRPVEETLAATTALHMAALQNGASILRVHDVAAAVDAIAVYRQLALT
jgi:dihydropteroate synthase